MADGDRQLEAYKRSVSAGWHAAVFSRQKKIPSLADSLRKLDRRPAGPVAHTEAELRQRVLALNASLGGKVVRLENNG